MTGIETMTQTANSESFYAGALGRISRLMIVLAIALSAAAWWRQPGLFSPTRIRVGVLIWRA